MNKILYTSSVLAGLTLTLFTGCKKDTVAFPDKAQSNGTYADFAYVTPYFPTVADADAILIAAQVTNEKTVIISPYSNEYEYGMAKFANNTGNFNSLADAGSITLNDTTLVKSSSLSYLSSASNYTIGLGNQAVWNVSGNSTYQTTYTLTGANPLYSYAFSKWDSKWVPTYPKTLVTGSSTYHADSLFNVSAAFVIPIKNYTTNADTVIIYMNDASGFSYIRKVPATDSIASFKPNDFYGYPNYDFGTYNIQVSAIKYNSSMVGSKKFYFLKMQSNIKYAQATK